MNLIINIKLLSLKANGREMEFHNLYIEQSFSYDNYYTGYNYLTISPCFENSELFANETVNQCGKNQDGSINIFNEVDFPNTGRGFWSLKLEFRLPSQEEINKKMKRYEDDLYMHSRHNVSIPKYPEIDKQKLCVVSSKFESFFSFRKQLLNSIFDALPQLYDDLVKIIFDYLLTAV
jgi:hypothetical protein